MAIVDEAAVAMHKAESTYTRTPKRPNLTLDRLYARLRRLTRRAQRLMITISTR